MTDAAATQLKNGRLKKRHAAERRFRLYGRMAIIVALSFLVLLLGRIGMQGYSTFTTNTISLPVYLDPARIDPADLEGSNYDYVVALSLLKRMGETEDEMGTASADAMAVVLWKGEVLVEAGKEIERLAYLIWIHSACPQLLRYLNIGLHV